MRKKVKEENIDEDVVEVNETLITDDTGKYLKLDI